MLSLEDWNSLWLSLELASVSTILLLVIAIPLALWLAFSRSRFKALIYSLVTIPLILPSTVLGFYLLLAMGPHGFIGALCHRLGINQLPFTFNGLVIASIIYSLPFVMQSLQNTFVLIGRTPLEVASTLGASKLDALFNIMLPQARLGIISAAILGFAHTIGEFGIVLIIGGNIPQQTQVAAVQIYNHIEAYEYSQANKLSLILLGFSFIVIVFIHLLHSRYTDHYNDPH